MDEPTVSPEIILDARRRTKRGGALTFIVLGMMWTSLLVIRLVEAKTPTVEWQYIVGSAAALGILGYYSVGWWQANRDLRTFRALHDARLRAEFGR
ncbi:hypothetical protein ACL9RL_07445 [Plantibacter sp. Mn2098]|uniref:hypothetical protein n=1 Tax=Plantibacter sp. Mn2098 TaxID=3395266 RepID=UPI003BBAE9B5